MEVQAPHLHDPDWVDDATATLILQSHLTDIQAPKFCRTSPWGVQTCLHACEQPPSPTTTDRYYAPYHNHAQGQPFANNCSAVVETLDADVLDTLVLPPVEMK